MYMENITLYHEVSPDTLDSVFTDGLQRTSRGEKGSDVTIAATDHLLDTNRPHAVIEAEISRDDNIYAYVGIDDKIIDIIDGNHVELAHFVKHNSNAVLALTVDPNRCFVSDLDQYDAIKAAVTDLSQTELENMSTHYWETLIPLHMFKVGDIRRPEVMITYDLQPSEIKHIEIG